MNFQEAVDHYYPKKKSGEMSLADIREEIQQRHDFREEQVKEIVRQISDRELEEINEGPKNPFAFLNHIGLSYFMVVANLAIIIFCCYMMYENRNAEELGAKRFTFPLIFISGAVTLIFRNVMKIRAIKREKARSERS